MVEGASAFADTTELAERWRALTDDEAVKADRYLGDASRDIRRAYPDLQARMANDADLIVEVARITCNVVRRRMTGEPVEGVEQKTVTRGPFTDQVRYRERRDELEVTAYERRILAGDQPAATTAATAAWSNLP